MIGRYKTINEDVTVLGSDGAWLCNVKGDT